MDTIEKAGSLVPHEAQAVTPMAMLNMAVSQGADLDKLKQLMDLQERWEATEARKAFVAAMTDFKKDPPKIIKDKDVAFGTTKYSHATLANVCEQIVNGLSRVGISHKWMPEQADGKIKVTCILTHVKGHSESTALEAGADTSGAKNSIQAIGSTVTYLQRYTLLAATGLASEEADDDGAKSERLPDDQYQDYVERIEAQTKKDEAKKVWQEAVKVCEALKDVESANKLKAVMLKHAVFIDKADKVAA